LLLSHDVGRGIKAIKESTPLEEEKKGMHYRRDERIKRMRT
jgi:hypothetical protein